MPSSNVNYLLPNSPAISIAWVVYISTTLLIFYESSLSLGCPAAMQGVAGRFAILRTIH